MTTLRSEDVHLGELITIVNDETKHADYDRQIKKENATLKICEGHLKRIDVTVPQGEQLAHSHAHNTNVYLVPVIGSEDVRLNKLEVNECAVCTLRSYEPDIEFNYEAYALINRQLHPKETFKSLSQDDSCVLYQLSTLMVLHGCILYSLPWSNGILTLPYVNSDANGRRYIHAFEKGYLFNALSIAISMFNDGNRDYVANTLALLMSIPSQEWIKRNEEFKQGLALDAQMPPIIFEVASGLFKLYGRSLPTGYLSQYPISVKSTENTIAGMLATNSIIVPNNIIYDDFQNKFSAFRIKPSQEQGEYHMQLLTSQFNEITARWISKYGHDWREIRTVAGTPSVELIDDAVHSIDDFLRFTGLTDETTCTSNDTFQRSTTASIDDIILKSTTSTDDIILKSTIPTDDTILRSSTSTNSTILKATPSTDDIIQRCTTTTPGGDSIQRCQQVTGSIEWYIPIINRLMMKCGHLPGDPINMLFPTRRLGPPPWTLNKSPVGRLNLYKSLINYTRTH